MNNSFELNDWVFIKFEGIFRIDKIIQEYYDESEMLPISECIGNPVKEKIFILKGLLDTNFEKSIFEKYCREGLISKLTSEQEERLNHILRSSPDLVAEFYCYEIPAVKRYLTIPLDIKFPEDLEKVDKLVVFIDSGKTFVEIDEQMQYLGVQNFDKSVGYMGRFQLNITNIDFECNNKKRIWREAQLLSYER